MIRTNVVVRRDADHPRLLKASNSRNEKGNSSTAIICTDRSKSWLATKGSWVKESLSNERDEEDKEAGEDEECLVGILEGKKRQRLV